MNLHPRLLNISKPTHPQAKLPSNDSGEGEMGVYQLRLKFPREEYRCNENDDDDISHHLILRFVMAGDKFLPPWKSSEVKISQFLRSQRIKLEDRQRMPVLVAKASNQIIAVGEFVSKDYYVADHERNEDGGQMCEEQLQILTLEITKQNCLFLS